MQTTREIPREQWDAFLADFLENHRDEEVRVEVAATDLGDQQLGTASSLLGLEIEPKGSAKGELDIALVLKGETGSMMDHRIRRPEHVFLLEGTDDGMDCLSIEDHAHRKTLVFVRGARA